MADEYGIQRGLQNLDPSKPEPLVAWLGYTIKGTFRIYILNHPAQYYVRFPDGRLAQAYHDGRIYVTDSITNALVSVELSLDHKGYYHIERLSTPEQDANVQTNGTGIYVPHHVHDAADITTGELALARGGLGVDASAFTGYLFVAGGVVVQKKANYAASIAPTVSNDNTEGYSIGSEWVDTVTGTVYKAVDVTTGAAVWSDLSGGGSISVDDGTDTVNPASQVSFDPAFFDVTDAGGGQALVTFIGTGGGGGGGGGTPPTLLLNYTETATVFSNTVLAATTWTDVGVNHTFAVTDAAALIDITAVMAMQVGGSGSAIDIGLRLVIDSAGTPIYHELGGGWAAASAWYEPAGGSIKVSGLSVGAHTVKLQVYATSAAHLFLDPSGLPDTEGMTLQVTQLSGGGSGGSSPALIYDYTLPSDGTFDTNSMDDLGNTGISQLYTDLELRISGIGAAGVTGGVQVFFNGDTNTAHYDGGRKLINGGESGGDLNEIGFVATPGVGLYGSIIADVPGYTLTATHRTMIARSAVDGGGTSPNYWHYGLQHDQAGALTRFQAHCRLSGNFAAGSRLRIYGVP